MVTAVTLLWPGAINSWFGQSYSVQASWGVSRTFFESVTLGAMVVLGVVFWPSASGTGAAGLWEPSSPARRANRHGHEGSNATLP